MRRVISTLAARQVLCPERNQRKLTSLFCSKAAVQLLGLGICQVVYSATSSESADHTDKNYSNISLYFI